MNDSPPVRRRPRRPLPLTGRTAAAIAAAIAASAVIAACGSGSPSSTVASGSGGGSSSGRASSSGGASSSGRTNPDQAQAQQDTLDFARCMRSHGVSNFPDDLNFRSVPGINPSSPAFEAAQAACQKLLPVKAPPPAPPSAQTHARLLRLANCLRTHGYPSIPDPRTNPPPSPGSDLANAYGTLYGEGDYWIGIPNSIDAHGAAFIRTARACGATGVG